MPKRQDITPANPYTAGKSVWFDDGEGNILSGVVKDSDGTTVNIKSGTALFICTVGEDKMWTENPNAAPEVVTPEVEAPAKPTAPRAFLGATVQFDTSTGRSTGIVEGHDGEDLMVRKPGNSRLSRVKSGEYTVVPATQDAVAAPAAPDTPPPVKPAPAPAPAPAPVKSSPPAVRPTGAVAKAPTFSNVMGDVLDDPELLQIPRLLIAQTVKDHEKLGLKRGDICLGMGEDPSGWVTLAASPGKVKSRTPAPGVSLMVLMVDSYWIEQVPYETEKDDGTQPLMARTREELTAVTARAQYELAPEAKMLVAVAAPDGVDSDHFRFEIGGKKFALATIRASRSGFRPLVVPVNTKVKLGGRPPQDWHFRLFSEIVEGEKNIFAKPVMLGDGVWPADIVDELSQHIPSAT